MARGKSYYFIIDKLTPGKAMLLKRGLLELSIVVDVKVDVRSSVVEVKALKKIEETVKTVCSLAGLELRTRIDKKDL
ncbi:hypothetical protein [Marispirochaeta sp.]|jgi:hypothetical protein|uniref:hypothetical protein n=1 Tax=Marispirochaeta sp. TaxID=2038653 RepID=UPI0029C89A85|nr:hypothetical protein [Marispirochaeta sp.]